MTIWMLYLIFENGYREEADVDEFLISGDHDHYISPETIVLPNDAVAYEETSCEPPRKKRKPIKLLKMGNSIELIGIDGHFFYLLNHRKSDTKEAANYLPNHKPRRSK